jgi:hypothetical protein
VLPMQPTQLKPDAVTLVNPAPFPKNADALTDPFTV